MLDDSDVHWHRQIKSCVGGVTAAVTGDPAVFVSVSAAHQGPDGGGPVAAIVDLGGDQPRFPAADHERLPRSCTSGARRAGVRGGARAHVLDRRGRRRGGEARLALLDRTILHRVHGRSIPYKRRPGAVGAVMSVTQWGVR